MDVHLETYSVTAGIPISGITSIRIQNGCLLVDDYEYDLQDIKELCIEDDDNSAMCAECTEVNNCEDCDICMDCERICDNEGCPERE